MSARLRVVTTSVAMAALVAAACTSSSLPPSTSTTVLDRTFNVDDVGLYINCAAPESEPMGTHTIILLHGSGERAHSGIWTKVQPRLAQEALTCRYDRPGMGKSAGLPSTGREAGAILSPPCESCSMWLESTDPSSLLGTLSAALWPFCLPQSIRRTPPALSLLIRRMRT